MKLFIVGLLDVKLGAYLPPMAVQSLGLAERSLSDEVNSGSKSDVAQHPEDFQLFSFGEFDTDSGVLSPNTVPSLVAHAAQLKV